MPANARPTFLARSLREPRRRAAEGGNVATAPSSAGGSFPGVRGGGGIARRCSARSSTGQLAASTRPRPHRPKGRRHLDSRLLLGKTQKTHNGAGSSYGGPSTPTLAPSTMRRLPGLLAGALLLAITS